MRWMIMAVIVYAVLWRIGDYVDMDSSLNRAAVGFGLGVVFLLVTLVTGPIKILIGRIIKGS